MRSEKDGVNVRRVSRFEYKRNCNESTGQACPQWLKDVPDKIACMKQAPSLKLDPGTMNFSSNVKQLGILPDTPDRPTNGGGSRISSSQGNYYIVLSIQKLTSIRFSRKFRQALRDHRARAARGSGPRSRAWALGSIRPRGMAA